LNKGECEKALEVLDWGGYRSDMVTQAPRRRKRSKLGDPRDWLHAGRLRSSGEAFNMNLRKENNKRMQWGYYGRREEDRADPHPNAKKKESREKTNSRGGQTWA